MILSGAICLGKMLAVVAVFALAKLVWSSNTASVLELQTIQHSSQGVSFFLCIRFQCDVCNKRTKCDHMGKFITEI